MGTHKTQPHVERDRPAFELGRIEITNGFLAKLHWFEAIYAVSRHQYGNWGDVCPDEWASNERALLSGARLYSEYVLGVDCKICVITEAEDDSGRRHATTVLLPGESTEGVSNGH